MLNSHTDPQFAFFLVQQRQQSLLAEAEHDRLVKQVMNPVADNRPMRKIQSRRLSSQFIAALMLAAPRPGSKPGLNLS